MRAMWNGVAGGLLVGAVLATGGCVSGGSGAGAVSPEIDTARFDASGPVERAIVVERVMPASVDEVFATFTTSEKMTATLGVRASIDLRIGGEFELWFAPDAPAGSRGSEDCRILSYIPGRMLSFSWNAPPSIPDARGRRSWVVVEFEPLNDAWSRVRLTHTGFGTGDAWDATHNYFTRAWPGLLGAMQQGFAQRVEFDPGVDALAFMVGQWRGTAPDGGVAEAWVMPPTNGAMVSSFRWTPPVGDASVVEISTMSERDGSVEFDIRHFDSELTPWSSEADGPMRLRLDDIGFGRAVFTPVERAGNLESISYELVNDTLRATVARGENPAPLVLEMSRVP